MKTSFLKTTLVAALFATTSLTSTAQVYEEGSKILNVGFGLGSTITGSGFKSTIPPIGASFEYGIKEKISVGGYVGYAGASYEQATFGGTWKWNYSYIIVGARGSYHFDFLDTDKFDPYVGVMLGYNAASVKVEKPAGYTGPDITAASAGGIIYGGHAGIRYLFTEKIGAFAELGYGIAFLQLGVTAKF